MGVPIREDGWPILLGANYVNETPAYSNALAWLTLTSAPPSPRCWTKHPRADR